MNGQLALYRRKLGVVPVAVSLLTIIWTTIVLTWVKSNLMADDVEDLALAYVLPTIVIAIFFGSTLAVASSFVTALAAAYFIYPPGFTFYIADPLHIAELGFIVLLSLTASKAVGVITGDRTPKARRHNSPLQGRAGSENASKPRCAFGEAP
jgi:K+-sensing histidine kinase KdpD